MSADDERHALELRVEHARAHLHDRIEGFERRGKRALRTAARAAEAAAVLILGLGALCGWLLWRAVAATRMPQPRLLAPPRRWRGMRD